MHKIVLGLVLLTGAGAAQAVTMVPTRAKSNIVAAKSLPTILVPEYANLPDRLPDATPLSAVPEPSTWALLGAGFGLVGYGLRRRKTVVA